MERLEIRTHKKLLRLIVFFLKRYKTFFLQSNNVVGFFMGVRGKLGVSGNSKRRSYKYIYGNISTSSKHNKYQFNQTLVRTKTGVLGVTFVFCYVQNVIDFLPLRLATRCFKSRSPRKVYLLYFLYNFIVWVVLWSKYQFLENIMYLVLVRFLKFVLFKKKNCK